MRQFIRNTRGLFVAPDRFNYHKIFLSTPSCFSLIKKFRALVSQMATQRREISFMSDDGRKENNFSLLNSCGTWIKHWPGKMKKDFSVLIQFSSREDSAVSASSVFFNFALKASLIQFEEAFANFLTTSIKGIYITYQPSPANQHAD